MFSAQNKMSMNKQQYKERIHLLVEKLKTNEDRSYWQYLQSLVSENITNDKIDDIYELCIEKIIQKQAEDFYVRFPLNSIKQNLIEDFVRMESFRRKNNFEDFCLALYQQIECMTNTLCTNKMLDEIVSKMWSSPAYIEYKKGIKPDITRRLKDSEYNIAKLVLIASKETYLEKCKKSIQNQYALDKIRIVVYFVGYRGMMRIFDYENYVEMTSSLNDIYQCRNLNHRGMNHTEWEQKILDRIMPQKSYYYFKFLGTLAQYVNYIIEGYKELQNMLEYTKSITPKPIEPSLKVIRQIDPSLLNDGKKRIK